MTSHAGQGHNNAAFAAKLLRRSKMNDESMLAFAVAMAGLASVFIIFHLLRTIGQRFGLEPRAAKNPSLPVFVSRKIRSILLRKVPALPSAGHIVIVLLYMTINLIVTFTNHDNNNLNFHANLASRTGWMAIVNLLVVVVLALKNTPLAFLTSWSHERLNILHQLAGYTTVIFVIIHACAYSSYFALDGRISRLREIEEIFGIVGGFAFFVLAFAGAVIRRWSYELFYYIHVSFWIIAIVMVGLHQPEFSKKILYVTITAGVIWGLDRLIRVMRIAIYSSNNSVVLTPLPHGGTRVTVKKAPLGAFSGKHCFLWIPGVRALETHPFTIAAMNPLEFVVASYDGFTNDLHKHAVQHSGVPFKASVEGSYGTFPDPMDYDKLVLIAGGSGASFTFGVALNLLKRMKDDGKKEIVFIWMVKHHSYLAWFSDHLRLLKSNEHTSIQLYVTRTPSAEVTTPPADPSSVAEMEAKSTMSTNAAKSTALPKLSIPSGGDVEKISSPTSPVSDMMDSPLDYSVPVTYEKPDVAVLIRAAIDDTLVDKRVLVMGCGPERLMTTVRDTTARCVRTEGPGVELHCEQFGW